MNGVDQNQALDLAAEPDAFVAQVQGFVKSKRPAGFGYSGAADGILTEDFLATLNSIQNLLTIGSGSPVKVVSGRKISPNAIVNMTAAMAKINGEPVVPQADAAVVAPAAQVPTISNVTANKQWISFLSENLPVVGTMYNGDVGASAKKLEAAIGAALDGKSIEGVIWNDSKKTFNTTPDDIRKALSLIASNKKTAPKKACFTVDQRVFKMSQILCDASNKKS